MADQGKAPAKRRGHGEDSIYWDEANATYVGSVSAGWVDGRRRRRTVRGRTKAEVRNKLKALHAELEAGVKTSANYTVNRAIDDWLSEALDGRSEKTVRLYRDVLKPITATIGTIPLRELEPHDVRRALIKLGKDRSTRTVQIAHNALSRAVRHAQANGHVIRNVAELANRPEGQEGRPSKALTVEQASALLKAAQDSRLHAYVVLSLLTGVRTEEARALTWDHVDLDGDPKAEPPRPPHVAVWRSVRRHRDTKTQKSRRTLALPQSAVLALRDHKKRQAQDRLAAGPAWQDRGLVFASEVGTGLDAANVRRGFKAICEAAGLGRAWTPQELRHSFVSMLSATGVAIEEIARIVGHSESRTTEVIYRKELRPVLTRGAEAMDAILEPYLGALNHGAANANDTEDVSSGPGNS